MKRAVLIAAVVLALAGCVPGEKTDVTDILENRVTLKDGRVVTCLIYSGGGGFSCDWENAQ